MGRILPPYYTGRTGVALLLLRLVVGLAFIYHGLPKIQDIGGFAQRMGIPPFLGAAAACSEFFGGILIILGALTPAAASLIAIVMLVALFKVHHALLPGGDPFVSTAGRSYESAAVYLFVMALFLLAGPGAYGVDAWVAERLRRPQASRARAPG